MKYSRLCYLPVPFSDLKTLRESFKPNHYKDSAHKNDSDITTIHCDVTHHVTVLEMGGVKFDWMFRWCWYIAIDASVLCNQIFFLTV